MKTQSRAFRTSDRQKVHLPMNLNTQQEWLIGKSVNVLEWPNHSLSLNPIKYFWRNLNMCVCSIQPDRAWEVKRGGEEWQIIAKCWWAKLVASNKKDLRLSRYLVKLYLVKDMNTYAMYLFEFFCLYIHLQSSDNSVFALSIWCIERRLMWGKK